jgi:ABC-2 type transport system permease protein
MNNIKKYIYLVNMSLKSSLAYLKDFLISKIFLVFVLITFFFVYRTLLGQNDKYMGFTLPMLLYYLVVTESIEMSKVLVHNRISSDIKDGSVAYQLIRPMSFILYHFFSSIGEIILKNFVTLVIGFLAAFVISGFKTIPVWQIFAGLPVIYGAVCLNLLFMINIGMFAFYIEETKPIYWIYQKLVFIISGLFVPLEFFPPIVLKILRYSPFTYMNYFSAKMVVKFNFIEYLQGFSIQLIYIVLLFSTAFLIYQNGIKRVNIQGG